MEQKELKWWVKEFREELIKAYEGILPIEALKGGNPWFESFVAKVEEDARKDERERVLDALEDYFMGRYPIPDAKVIGGFLREALKGLDNNK